MPQPPLVLHSGQLRVEFHWRADRYAHRISVLEAAVAHSQPDPKLAILESVEGTPQENWPASPALQHAHVEERTEGQRVALLVGMAGSAHWSAAVTFSGNEERVTFDVACRSPAPPNWLGSTYALKCSATAASSSRPLITLDQIAGEPPAELTSDPERLAIVIPHSGDSWPRTIRWRYCVTAEDLSRKPG